ncbi:putative adhesion G protein-coupled receptor E4P isoform X6 [Polyodon spathula]|uniref:putative adhesion G protein-coupled receptor E4P isoform X6 n=1 Tax=Polyodon spathula TaxID=7913 RepID=UPI001B7EF1BE|nr:putative adhesion G protein-coupled receptor E4P isoform X6 [Polyodon spathula]
MQESCRLLLLGICIGAAWDQVECSCNSSSSIKESCGDRNKCADPVPLCPNNSHCFNTPESFYCLCWAGFRSTGKHNFTEIGTFCNEINECKENRTLCGQNAWCQNTIGNYSCSCKTGFRSSSGQEIFMDGQSSCAELRCPEGPAKNEASTPLGEIQRMLRETCLQQSDQGSPDGKQVLKDVLGMVDHLLHAGPLPKAITSRFLQIVEDAVMRVALLLDQDQTQINGTTLGVEIRLSRFSAPPQGPVTLGSGNVTLNTDWSTVAGENSSGFAVAALVSYYNLEESLNHSFNKDSLARENHTITSVQLNSKIVSAAISNGAPERLSSPVDFTFSHLQLNDSGHAAVCVYWKDDSTGGSWSRDGCETVWANQTYTTCRCHHLSSFAVLMALYEIQDTFELQLITWVGLGLSLLCLLLSILTFSCCRSVKGTRSTIHLHLCISLFIADLVFLAGISSTSNKGGCALVAGLLHFFFLAVFTWMCLEGIQLYRMVVTVFNATLSRRFMLLFGYGIPALIVGISAAANSQGYGTKRYCWLSLDKGFIWSFFGPVCVIILLNVLFFVITIWKLAEKFASINPDLSNLKKIQ